MYEAHRQSAGPLGTKAADTVLSRVAGTAPAVIDQAFFGACISVGRKSGILQFARKDDRAVNLFLSGRFVASIKGSVQEHAVVAAPRGAHAGFGVLVQGGSRPEQPSFAPVVVTER